ncbi:MAG TPA: hypothetical protein VHE37_16805 [Nevskiaceae bacterium]|nr:hypothetical protein [Nevskiaceae bacterium]
MTICSDGPQDLTPLEVDCKSTDTCTWKYSVCMPNASISLYLTSAADPGHLQPLLQNVQKKNGDVLTHDVIFPGPGTYELSWSTVTADAAWANKVELLVNTAVQYLLRKSNASAGSDALNKRGAVMLEVT